MEHIGIRALKQNASAVVARVAAGESLVITDRGRPIAQLVPLREPALERLVTEGIALPPTGSLADLPAPLDGPPLTPVLQQMRDEER